MITAKLAHGVAHTSPRRLGHPARAGFCFGLGTKKNSFFPQLPVNKPLVVKVIVVGPFEEEEEGTGVASDVVKVEGEDPDTPGYLRGDRVRLGRRRFLIVGASPLARSQ